MKTDWLPSSVRLPARAPGGRTSQHPVAFSTLRNSKARGITPGIIDSAASRQCTPCGRRTERGATRGRAGAPRGALFWRLPSCLASTWRRHTPTGTTIVRGRRRHLFNARKNCGIDISTNWRLAGAKTGLQRHTLYGYHYITTHTLTNVG